MMKKSKAAVRTIAATLAATVGGGGVFAASHINKTSDSVAARDTIVIENESDENTENTKEETHTKVKSASDDCTVKKEETVYVNANANGNVEEIMVSDWLRNSGNTRGALLDRSSLADIENIKGDETFLQDGHTLVWNMQDEDIFYQGTTTKKLPIEMNIAYYLNDEEITPKELAGKDGHLRMEVTFKNNSTVNKKIDGEKATLYAPFVMVTGMLLPDDHFTNVTVENGKCVSDGSRNIVLGYGMPGLKENLDLPKEVSEKLPLNDGFTLEADVTDCELGGTYTAALTDILSDIDVDNIGDFDELKDSLDQLDDAAVQLVDGAEKLSDGNHELNEKYQTFADGLKQLADGIKQLSTGGDTLKTGLKQYTDGVDTLTGGLGQYISGVNALGNGVRQYTQGVGTLANGLNQYTDGVNTLGNGVKDYVTGVDTLGRGVKQYTAGADQLADGVKQYTAGTDKYISGVNESKRIRMASPPLAAA